MCVCVCVYIWSHLLHSGFNYLTPIASLASSVTITHVYCCP